MLPEVGHKFGPYEILGKLGGGGMGVVFRAWDDRLHREVAIKLLHDEFQAPGMRQRFLLEARAASALNHPHICTIFDMGEQDGEPFLVMEVLEGITLKERIAQGACSSEEIVRFGSEIAEALAAAHGKGIVHRDIKPANIFLQGKPGSDRQVKVLDFGLAKVSMALRSGRDSRALELTAAGSTVGTLAYMSPEQARGEHLDLRSDLFSLGVVLYEMATRRAPFRGATTALAFQALLTEAPDPIRIWNVAMPRELERIIMRLLLKDRSERYQTAREVEDALHRLATRGDGDWLRKLPRPAVPLVTSADPIARKPRKLRHRSESEREESAGAANSLQFPSNASEELDFIRPRRMPTPENRPRDVSISRTSSVQGPVEGTDQDPTSSNPFLLPIPNASPSGRLAAVERVEQSPVSSRSEAPAEVPSAPLHPGAMDAPAVASGRSSSAWTQGAAKNLSDTRTARSAAEVTISSPVVDSAAPTPVPEGSKALQPDTVSGATGPLGSQRKISTIQAARASGTVATNPLPTETQLRKTSAKLRTWVISAAGLAIVLLGLGIFLTRSGSFGRIVLSSKDTVLLAPVVNRTGDQTLDNVVAEGLEIELSQRSQIHWLGLAALNAGKTQAVAADHLSPEAVNTRTAAQRLGARAYLYGELSRADAGYHLRLDVIDVESNDRLGTVSEEASGRDDLPAAITRLSLALRSLFGETAQAGTSQASTPLALQATSSLTAFNLYAEAQVAVADGDLRRATDLYEHAVAEAPDFTLAELQLADIYSQDGAEIAAARSAAQALASSSRTGDRIAPLAQVTAALISDQDPARATVLARQFLAARPRDELALVMVARVMRSQGHMTEALLTAEQTYKLYPFSVAAYSEAAFALIGLDRFAEALTLDRKASALGLHCSCGRDIATYLSGSSLTAATPGDLSTTFNRALALDDSGQFSAGSMVWLTGVNDARGHAETVSAAAGMLAQAAVDRAFANRCAEAATFSREAELLTTGRLAAFHIALAENLCSTPSQKSTPQADAYLAGSVRLHSTTSELLFPLVRAAQAVAARESMPALAALSKVESERDPLPTAAYLRGMAHALGAQDALALADFQQTAHRRGYAFLSHSTVAPLAVHRVAELASAEGDVAAQAAATRQFQQLWANADAPLASQPKGKPHKN